MQKKNLAYEPNQCVCSVHGILKNKIQKQENLSLSGTNCMLLGNLISKLIMCMDGCGMPFSFLTPYEGSTF